jgi:glucose-1-phosphate adenylyltransferase
MKVDENGAIIEFVEKPQSAEELEAFKTPPQVLERYGVDPASGRHYLASMGVYIFRSPVLEDILEQQPEWIDFGKHVIPNSLSSYKVQSHLFSGFWEDIGTVRSYYDVSMSMCSATPPFNFQEGAQSIYTHPRFLPGSSVAHAHVSNSIICEGGEIIDAELAHSIVGIRSRIFPGARVRRAILMGADYYETEIDAGPIPLGIGEGAQVSQAIIDKNACIGRNSVIAGGQELEDTEGDGWAIRDGIVIILKNARIPDGTRIGAG